MLLIQQMQDMSLGATRRIMDPTCHRSLPLHSPPCHAVEKCAVGASCGQVQPAAAHLYYLLQLAICHQAGNLYDGVLLYVQACRATQK